MRKPARCLALDLGWRPVGVRGAKMADQHAARTAVHAAGDAEPLGAGLAADHLEHRFVGPFDDSRRKVLSNVP